MPHTHSIIGQAIYYLGAILYGNLEAVRYAIGAAALMVLFLVSFRSQKPFWVKNRWNYLLMASTCTLIALIDFSAGVASFRIVFRVISVPLLVLLAVSLMRPIWTSKIRLNKTPSGIKTK